VIVGVDGSAEGYEAVRQAALLTELRGRLEFLAAYQVVYPAAPNCFTAGTSLGDPKAYELEAKRSLERARAVATDFDVVVKAVDQRPGDALLDEALLERATLIGVGSHGRRRFAGILLGSVATEVIHRAPCSVLVARKGSSPSLHRIVVGVDGSPQSAAAYAAAAELAARFGAELIPVIAHGGTTVDRAAIGVLTAEHVSSPDDPVSALVDASSAADLLVVGSRGLHGVKALGSVSERVAHEARCSILIVRAPMGSR
jgi:nucleotide-binding universal stress UspA family protein